MKFVVFLFLFMMQSFIINSACYAIDVQLYKSESGAFSVIAPGNVNLSRLREDSRLIHEYRWNNGVDTLLTVGEGFEFKKGQSIEQYVDDYLEKVKKTNFIIVKKDKSKGNGWFGQKLYCYREETKELEQISLVAMSANKDLVYVLTAKPLVPETKMDKNLGKQFFDSFELDPEAASIEQKSKDMNSLGYSIGPLILAIFLFGFVFTIFFVLGVILYRMRQS